MVSKHKPVQSWRPCYLCCSCSFRGVLTMGFCSEWTTFAHPNRCHANEISALPDLMLKPAGPWVDPYFTSQSIVFSLYSIVGVGVTGPPLSTNWSGRVLQAISSVLATDWQEWRQRFELFLETTEATGKSDATRIAMMFTAIGPEGIQRLCNFHWAAGEDKTKFLNQIVSTWKYQNFI